MEATQFNKEKLYILGAGGLGREVESWFYKSNLSERYNLEGFIDDNKNALNNINNDFQVVNTFFESDFSANKNILLGIASTKIKEEVFHQLLKLKSKLISLIHHSVVIGHNNSLGEGLVLCPNVIITCNIKIGKCVTVNLGSQIGHDVTIGDYCSIMANVDLGGGVSLGNHVFIGSGAVILPGVKIPDYTRIGAGSIVIKSLKTEGTYFGNPAKKIF